MTTVVLLAFALAVQAPPQTTPTPTPRPATQTPARTPAPQGAAIAGKLGALALTACSFSPTVSVASPASTYNTSSRSGFRWSGMFSRVATSFDDVAPEQPSWRSMVGCDSRSI